jgi:hypothetical protein
MRSPRLLLSVPLSAGLALAALATVPLAPAVAEPVQDLAITSVRVDTSVDPRAGGPAGDIRQVVECRVVVDFDDLTPPAVGSDGFYELRTPTSEWEIASAYVGGEEVPTSIATYGCAMFEPGEPTELTLHYLEYDEDAGRFGDYVDVASSAPVDFTLLEVGHPTGARIEGPGVSSKGEVVETGTPAVITFDGTWAPDAVVTAKVTTTQGWTGIGQQDRKEREIPTTWDPDSQTFTFVPEASMAGRTVYVTVKGAAPGGDRADYLYTWSPMILVDPGARATKKAWVESFGRLDKKKSFFFLHTTKAAATRAGERAGVRFVYQGWFGKDTFYAWHSSRRASGIGGFGGCPVVEQHVRVLALVPGRLPIGRTISMDPPRCRVAAGSSPVAGVGSWG